MEVENVDDGTGESNKTFLHFFLFLSSLFSSVIILATLAAGSEIVA